LRDINDWLWLGAVMESYAICLQLKTIEDSDLSRDADVTARYREASQLYCKTNDACIPRIECHFKLARYHQEKGDRIQAMNAISSIFDVKLAMDEREKVHLWMSVGIFLHALGMQRKAGFFLRRAALTQLQFSRWDFAGSLLLKLSSVYRMEHLPAFVQGKLDLRKQAEIVDTNGWPMLQAMLLRDIMYTYMKLETAEHTARQLRHSYYDPSSWIIGRCCGVMWWEAVWL